ncbi:hypothetical protein VP1G_10632 [Cytospora mali]|uniref:Uncharacterized protein n=1 Tax=Cytospora mali TaxID=578113 RepID=A0A194USZ5_CYTMA|nr:hypothetical protein VP1G_10632 [Valsa mali var. pyri (nom. inval.)]
MDPRLSRGGQQQVDKKIGQTRSKAADFRASTNQPHLPALKDFTCHLLTLKSYRAAVQAVPTKNMEWLVAGNHKRLKYSDG